MCQMERCTVITPLGSVFDAANQQRLSYDCSYMTKTLQQQDEVNCRCIRVDSDVS
jgi:hypothetical protein